MKEIKVGDKVKVLNVSGCSPFGKHCVPIGSEHEVIRLNGAGYSVDYSYQTLQRSEIEPVEEWIEMVCVRPFEGLPNLMTRGKTYQVKQSEVSRDTYRIKQFDNCHPGGAFKNRFEDIKCPAPAPLTVCEVEKDNSGEFIIWSPKSSEVPSRTFASYKQARFVARKMATENGGVFKVMRLECTYTGTNTVIKEEA